LLDVEARKLVNRFPPDDDGASAGANEFKLFAVSSDGKHVASGGGAWRPVRVLDFRTGRLLRSFNADRTDVRALVFSPDGKWLAAGTAFRYGEGAKPYEGVYEIWMWDIAKDAPPLRFRGHKAPVQAIAFLGDGNRIVSASNDWTLRVWDMATQRELKRSWAPRVFGRPFGFPAAGTRFGGFDPGAGEWLNVPRLNRISLMPSADGKHLVCGRSVWNAHTLQLEYFVDDDKLWTDFEAWQRAHGRRSVPPSEAFGMIATNSVGGALTDDGRRLVYSGNGTACVFDVVATKLVLEDRVFSNGAGVFALDVSPDGRCAVVAGSGEAAGVGGAPVARDPCQLYVYRLPRPSGLEKPPADRRAKGGAAP
jgi:WD40 repeat protein